MDVTLKWWCFLMRQRRGPLNQVRNGRDRTDKMAATGGGGLEPGACTAEHACACDPHLRLGKRRQNVAAGSKGTCG